MSLRRRRATSPERNPNRANMSKIARSRSLPGVCAVACGDQPVYFFRRQTMRQPRQPPVGHGGYREGEIVAAFSAEVEEPQKCAEGGDQRLRCRCPTTGWLVAEESLERPAHSTGRHPRRASGVDLWHRGRNAGESVPSRHDGFETSRRRRSQEAGAGCRFRNRFGSSRSRAQRDDGGRASLRSWA